MKQRSIAVTTTFIDYHRYSNAPEEVIFLRDLHRHKFYVEMIISVKHNERELEFFMVQKALNDFIENHIKTMTAEKSCESIAESILDFCEVIYGNRKIQVKVSEDNENGSIICNY